MIDFLMKIENMSFCDSLEEVDVTNYKECRSQIIPKPEVAKILFLPEKAKWQINIFDYLCVKRGIDFEIVKTLAGEEKIYEDMRRNIVFVGHDEYGIPKFASVRGTAHGSQYRVDCAGSDKRYGFHMTYCQSPQLYIFESPIDAMSHATLENIITQNPKAWQGQNRLSLSGTSDKALEKYLELHPNVRELIFCLDNDPPGRDAAIMFAKKYDKKGFHTRLELPKHKDYNEELLFQNTLQKGWCDGKTRPENYPGFRYSNRSR